MKKEIKEMAPVTIFLPTVNQIIQIYERTRDNLSSIQIIKGYVGYLYYEQYDMQGLGEWVSDNGQIFKKEPVQDLYKSLTEAIPEVLEAAYGNAALPYVVLNERLASHNVTVYKEYNDEQEVTKKVSHCEDSKCSKNTIYTHDEAASILERFEDVLENYGIKVPSPEDDDRGEDNEAVLYGSVYSDLLEQVEEVLLDIINRAKNSTVIEHEFSGTV